MGYERYDRAGCDRCGETKDVRDNTRITALQGWLSVQAQNLHSSGLSGDDLHPHLVLCPACRKRFVAFMNEENVK